MAVETKRKVTDLPVLAAAAAGDLIHVIDVSDLTGSPQGTSKKLDITTLIGSVTAASNLGDNLLIRGDGAVKGVQNSGVSIDDSDNITGAGEITSKGITLSKVLGNSAVTGTLEGGLITVNGGDGTKFDISDGQGYVVDQFTDPDNPTVTLVSWSSETALTPTHAATFVTFIAVNSSGTILQQATEHTIAQRRDLIVLGFVGTADGTNVNTTGDESNPIPIGYTGDCLARALDEINLSGNNYSAASTNLTIRREAGETFKPAINRFNDPKSPNRKTTAVDTGVTFIYIYDNGSGGLTLVPAQTNIDPDQLDDGSGTLAAVANNKWTNQIMYWFPNSEIALVQYGDTEYSNLAGAESAIPTMTFANLFDTNETAAVRTILSVKKGTTDLSDSNTAFVNTGKFGFGGSGGGAGGTFQDMQDTYNNSVTPEILTDATRGAVTIQRGSAADSDNVLEGQNGAGTTTFEVDGNGDVTAKSVDIAASAAYSVAGTAILSDSAGTMTISNVDALDATSAASISAATAGVAQEYTKTQNFNATSLTSTSNSIAWDAESNQVVKHTATENTTIAAPSNLVDGATYIFTFTQHASSAKTLSFNAVFKWPGGTAPTVSTGANAVDVLTFITDGTNMFGTFSQDFS